MKVTASTANSEKDRLLPGQQSDTDPEFDDALPAPSIDPDAQDFRDEMDVKDALSDYGTVQGLDAELKEQQRQQEHDTLEVLEALRGLDAGQTVKWRITRNGTGDPKFDGFLDTWPTKLLTLERIRDKMGGGTYYLKGFRNGKYWVHKTVEIAGEPKLYRKEEGGTVVTTPSGSSFDVAGFLAQQESRDAARRAELVEERTRERREREEREAREKKDQEEREERRRRDRNEMIALVAPVLTGLTTAITGAFVGNRGSQMADIAALMTAMKGPDPITVLTQLKALNGNSDGAMTKILPMLIDMAGQKASGGDTGWLDVVKELAKSAGPTVGALIESSVQQARAAAQSQQNAIPSMTVEVQPQQPQLIVPEERRSRRTRSAPEPSSAGLPDSTSQGHSATRRPGSAATAGANSTPTMGGQVDMNFLKLAPHLPWLQDMLARLGQACARGKDPELYAALFLEELPDGIDINVVGQLLASQDWYGKLCQVDSRLNREDFLPWFTALRNHILGSISQEQGVSFASHAPATPSGDGRASARVEVRGPQSGVQGGNSATEPVQMSVPAPKPQPKEPQRPTQLPSLTGE